VKTIALSGEYHPVIFNAPSGKTYAISGINWAEVAPGTTLDQVTWIRSEPDVEAEVHKVPSRTDPSKYYEVFVKGSKMWCNCPGSAYRGRCWHIDLVKRYLGEE